MNKTTPKTISSRALMPILILLCSSLTAIVQKAHAQVINFTAGYPRFDQGTLVMLEEERTLTIRFTVTGNDLPNAAVAVTLPDDVNYTAANVLTSGVTINPTLAGRVLTLTVTSNGGTLPKEQEMQFEIKMRADCRAEASTTLPVKVLSAGTSKGTASASLNIARPQVTLVSDGSGIIGYTTPTETKTIGYYLRTATPHGASSARVTFTLSEQVTAANFQLNGTPITPTVSPSAGLRTYTLDFPSPAAMGGSKITNANDKKITFTATGSAVLCGQQLITSTVQYPLATPCGSTQAGPDVTLNISVAGPPTFIPQSIQYVASPSSTTPTAIENIPMDGSTPVYVKAVFKNSPTAAARSVKLQLVQGMFSIIDTANMYIQVDNGPVTKVYGSSVFAKVLVQSNQSWGYVKDAFKTRLNRIWLNTPVTVPPGSTLNFYYATINGDIHENEKKDVFHPQDWNHINSSLVQLDEATGFCNNTNKTSVQLQMPKLNYTHYQEKPSLVTFKDQETKTVDVKVNPGSFMQTPAVFTAKAPSWLTITDIKLVPPGAAFPAGVTVSYNTAGSNERSARIVSTGSVAVLNGCRLRVTYKAPVCGSDNKSDTIWYIAKQEWSGGHVDRISQVAQPVQLNCVVEGVGLDTFYVHRETRGYPDINNDGNPESTSLAHDSIITHTQFIPADAGYFYWKGKIGSSGSYNYLDIPLEAAKTLGRGFFTIGEGAFAIDLGPASGRQVLLNGAAASNTTITYHQKDDANGYIRIHKSDGFPNNGIIEVKVPFAMTGKVRYEAVGNITSGFYVSQNAIPDPYDPASAPLKVGGDVREIRITILELYPVVYAGPNTAFKFTTRAPKPNTQLATATLYESYIPASPVSFDKEARIIAYPKRITIALPAGYSLDDSLDIYRYHPTTGDVKKINTPESKVTNPDGTTKITWNLTDLYQTVNIAGALAAGKWRLPDENWRGVIPKGTLRVDPTVTSFKDTSKMFVYCEYWDPNTDQAYKDPYTGIALVRKNENRLIYNFNVKLDAAPAEITSYGPTVVGPQVTLTNNSADALRDVYYFFDGPIKNVTMKQVVGGTTTYTHASTTPNKYGCWVKVADLPANTRHTYELTYTDTVPQCNGHTVKVYVGSGYSGTWTPNTAQAFDPQTEPHFVEQTLFKIKPSTTAQIAGEILLFNPAKRDTIPEGSTNPAQTYTIRASLSSAGSEGMVKDLKMDLTVPVGQIYVPGSAQMEYPIGTFTPLPAGSALEAALAPLAVATDSPLVRTVQLKWSDTGITALGSDFTLPGYRSNRTDADSVYLKARLHLKFRAMCNTPFRGIQYAGKVHARNICNAPATDDGNDAAAFMIYPDVAYDYLFSDIDVRTTSQSYAYNEGWRRDTIILNFRRILGTTTNMKSTDYLEVLLPPQMNIDGDSVKYFGSGAMASLNARPKDSVMENTRTATFRRLKLPFPTAQYNAATPIKGVNAPVQCSIPVVYTPEGQTRAPNPVDSVQATIWSELQFGHCAPVPTDFGNGKHKVALFTAVAYPHIAWIGDTARFEITSRDFDGQWFKTKTGGSAASSNNPWVNIPLDTAMVGDTVLYFTPSIDGNSFGSIRLPYFVRFWLRPWFIRNLPRFAYFCQEQDTLRVKAGGMDVRYQWFRNGQPIAGATGTMLVVNRPGRYHVMVRDSVTPPNIIYSDTADVYFRERPVITKDLPDRRDCDSIYLGLSVEHTGRFMLYQWYRNGLPIPGATDSVYMASAYDSSGFYRVRVMNLCGDSVLSRRCYVDFCDDRWDPFARTVELFAPNTVATQPAGQMHQVPSRRDFRFTVRAQSGQSLRYATITADHPAWAENGGGIERTMSSDSVMTVIVRRVNQNLRIYVHGVTPTANLPVDPSARRVWTHRDRLYLTVDRPQSVRLYTVMGHLYREQSLPAGQTVIERLPSGFYIIRFADGTAEKVRVE